MSYINYSQDDKTISPLEKQLRSKALIGALKTHPELNDRKETSQNIIQLHDGNPPADHPNIVATLSWTLLPHSHGVRSELMDVLENKQEYSWWVSELKDNGGWEALKQAPQVNPAEYLSSTILPVLKESANKYFTDCGINIQNQDEICAGHGFRHILNSYGRVMQESGRDKMFIATPHYGSLNEVLRDRDVEFVQIQTSPPDYKLTGDLLKAASEEHPEVKDLLIINPNNPTGTILSEEELRDIADVALERGIFVVSDEIYSGEELEDGNAVSFGSLGEEHYKNSLSGIGLGKTYCDAADRIGIAATGNVEISRSIEKNSVRGTTSSPSTLSQYSAAMVLRYTPEKFLEKNRDFYSERLEFVESLVEKTNQELEAAGSDIKLKPLVDPKAGFYYTINFENTKGMVAYDGEPINNSLKLVEHIAISGLSINKNGKLEGRPGATLLDGDSLGISDSIAVRVNFAKSTLKQLEQGFSAITESIKTITRDKDLSHEDGKNVRDHLFSNNKNISASM